VKTASRQAGGKFGSAVAGKLIFAVIVAGAVIVDLWSKARYFSHEDSVNFKPAVEIVKDFFFISSARNSGGVFGMFQEHTIVLAVLSLLALVAAGVILFWVKGLRVWLHIALGLIMGGAFGNLYDRLLLTTPDGGPARYVRDFLDVYIFGYHWPTFNAADAFICIGAAMVVLRVLFDGRKKNVDPGREKRRCGTADGK